MFISSFLCPLFQSFVGAIVILCLVFFPHLSVFFNSLVYCSRVILLKFRSDHFTLLFKDLLFPNNLYPNKLVWHSTLSITCFQLNPQSRLSTILPHVHEFLPSSLNTSNLQPLDYNYHRARLLHFPSSHMGWFYVEKHLWEGFWEVFSLEMVTLTQ